MSQINLEQLKSQIKSGDTAALLATMKSFRTAAEADAGTANVAARYEADTDTVVAIYTLEVDAPGRILASWGIALSTADEVGIVVDFGVPLGKANQPLLGILMLPNASQSYSGQTLTALVVGLATDEDGKNGQTFTAQAKVTVGS